MDSGRRNFLIKTALAGSALALPVPGMEKAATATDFEPVWDGRKTPRHPLKILILGGTSFVGPHLIKYALERGHEISIFTRGRTTPTVHADLLDHVEKLIGDRNDNLSALEGRTWDVVIDNSGRQVEWTRDSAQLLKDSAGLYLYTSSTGVYYPYLDPPITESRQLVTEVPTGISGNEQGEYGYGVMKTLSEREARKAFGEDRTIVVRPTYIIGPGDRGNRFVYWPVRLQKGGEVMIPGNPEDPVQFIDVRDVAEFSIRLVETGAAGTYNVAGPASRMGIHACVYGIHAVTSSPVEWVSIPDYDFLLEHNVPYIVPWIMPMGNDIGSARAVNDLAISIGLTFRPLADTSRDVLNWWNSNAITQERRDSLTEPENSLFQREKMIIQAWRSR